MQGLTNHGKQHGFDKIKQKNFSFPFYFSFFFSLKKKKRLRDQLVNSNYSTVQRDIYDLDQRVSIAG